MTMLGAAMTAAMGATPAATAWAVGGRQLRAATEGGRARGLPAEGVATMSTGTLAIVRCLLDTEEPHAGSTHRIETIPKAR